jgi:hypothetical protein
MITVPLALGHGAVTFFLQDEVEVGKTYGDEIGMGVAETG